MATQTSPVPAVPLQARRGATVVVVEDDEAMRTLLEEVLVEAGYNVVATGDPLSALIQVLADDADVVITDWKMPGYDGLTLATALRRCRPEVPVVLVSAHADTELCFEAARAGVVGFLPKPFRLEALIRETAHAIDLGRERASLGTPRVARDTRDDWDDLLGAV